MADLKIESVSINIETFEPVKAVITVEGEGFTAECIRRLKEALYQETDE